MSGGITQLVAVGIQDAYLSGNPEISFFRSSYKRYTHYAQNVERQIIQGNPTQNGVSLLRFEKKGDLLSDVYLTARDGNNTSNVNVNWNQIISKMELMIGGQIIDTQDMTYTSNIDPVVNAKSFSHRLVPANINTSVFLPLKFFFCRDWQNAIPLVALQYHDVEIRITWAQPNAWDQYIAWARFIYLDNDEREWFAKNKHDMLITQVVRVPITPVNNYEFALAQPVKYIAFESNNYTSVYNSGGNLGTTIPVINTTAVGVGMPVSLPQYLPSSNSYVTSVTDSTITVSSQNTQTIPAGTAIPFNTITGNFSLTGSATPKTVSVASGTTSLASLPTQIATGWEVLVAGPSVTAALAVIVYTVLTVTITNGVISALTLNSSADASAFSGTSANLLFMPPASVNTSINSLGSFATTFAVTASGTTSAVTLTTSSPHNIPTTGTFTAQISGLVTTGSTANGSFTITSATASTFTYTAGGSVTAFTTATGTMTITAYTPTAGNSTPIQSSTPTYIVANVPGNFQTGMVGYTVVVPQVGTGASSFAVGTITSVDNSTTGSTVNPPAGTSLVTVQFPSTGTYPTTTQITTSATAASATLFYTYPPFVYSEASVTGGSLNQGSLQASNMQFKMQINGNDIGDSRELPHWVDVNQYYLTPYGYYNDILIGTPQVAVIPFCLDTAKVQPTGSLNFSRIDTFRLVCPSQTNFVQLSKLGTGSYFYAVNYNVLRIQNGMGAVMYSS
jgi:hypothetical protein